MFMTNFRQFNEKYIGLKSELREVKVHDTDVLKMLDSDLLAVKSGIQVDISST